MSEAPNRIYGELARCWPSYEACAGQLGEVDKDWLLLSTTCATWPVWSRAPGTGMGTDGEA